MKIMGRAPDFINTRLGCAGQLLRTVREKVGKEASYGKPEGTR